MTMENDLVERLRRQYRDGLMFLPDDFKIVGYDEAADRIQALEAELARKTEALPDLSSVISWLENGCDPNNGAKELRIYAARIAAALEEKTDV